MSKKVLVNSKTGEIIEAEEHCPFASITDLKRDPNDVESYEAGTSVVSLEGYEPLDVIVSRCMRTVKSPNGVVYQVLDKDALKAEETQTGIYEASGAKTLDEAFDTLDPTASQGFDLVDADRIKQRLQLRLGEGLTKTSATATSSKLSTQGRNEALKYSEVTDVVGNSESKSAVADFPEKKEYETKQE